MEKVWATQVRMKTLIIGLRWHDKVTNGQVRKVTQMGDVGYKTKKLKGKFAGYVARKVGLKQGDYKHRWARSKCNPQQMTSLKSTYQLF